MIATVAVEDIVLSADVEMAVVLVPVDSELSFDVGEAISSDSVSPVSSGSGSLTVVVLDASSSWRYASRASRAATSWSARSKHTSTLSLAVNDSIMAVKFSLTLTRYKAYSQSRGVSDQVFAKQ